MHLTQAFTFRIRQPAILYPRQYVISTWVCPVCSVRRHVTGTPSSRVIVCSPFSSFGTAIRACVVPQLPTARPRRPGQHRRDGRLWRCTTATTTRNSSERRSWSWAREGASHPLSSYAEPLHVWITLFMSIANTFRSGKTSILKVLFEGLNPKQAFFTEPTTRLTKYKIEYVMQNARSCAQVLTAYKFR